MSVSTRLKRVTVGMLAAIVLAAGGLIVAPHVVVSEQEAKLAAMRALRAATGLEPQIGGATELLLLPSPAVRIENIRIDDGVRPAFTAGAMQATVRMLPLLYGRIEIASLTFERAELAIETGADGDIRFGIPLRPQAAPEPSRPELRFADGTIRFKPSDTKEAELLFVTDAAFAWSGAGVTGTGAFIWRATRATFSLSINDLASLGRGDRSGFRLRLESEPMNIGFDGGIAYRNGIQADGVLAAEARSLRNSLSLLSIAPLTRGGFGPFKLKAKAVLTANSLAFDGLSLELDGNRAEGGITIKHADGRTVLQATLASEASDFTPYSGGFAVTDEDGRDWNREPIDLGALDAFDLDIRLSSGRVTVRRTQLERVAASATLRNGSFNLSVGEARYHGGALQGRLVVSPGPEGTADVKVEANVANFNLGPGMVEIAGIHRLEGKGTLALALAGSGKHVHGITRALSGNVTLTAADGALAGINVEQVLRRLERKPLSGPPDFAGGRTPFKQLSVKMRIAEGTAKVEEAQVESPLVRVKLAGKTSVAHRDFDLQGMATLVRAGANSKEAQPFDLPFWVMGPWEKPFLLPDPVALIRRSDAAAPLLDAVRKQTDREKSSADSEPTGGGSGLPAETSAEPKEAAH